MGMVLDMGWCSVQEISIVLNAEIAYKYWLRKFKTVAKQGQFRIIIPSCFLRYANYSLIQEASAPVPPPLPSPLPGNGKIYTDLDFSWIVPLNILDLFNCRIWPLCGWTSPLCRGKNPQRLKWINFMLHIKYYKSKSDRILVVIFHENAIKIEPIMHVKSSWLKDSRCSSMKTFIQDL